MSRLLMQRRHDVLEGGERQPLIIHEWLATSYDPSTLTMYDTGAYHNYDGGTFDFIADNDNNITLYDDYIYFDGSVGSAFIMPPEAVAELNLGRSIVVELDWMPESLASGLNSYLTDFGSLTSVADGKCAFATFQHFSYLGFNLKFYSQSWASSNSITYTANHAAVAYTRYSLRFVWDNNGEVVTVKYLLNGEEKVSFEATTDIDHSWDRFNPDIPIYIGRGSTVSYSYNKPWRFYGMRIYNYD